MLKKYLEVQPPKGLAANHLEKPDGSPPATEHHPPGQQQQPPLEEEAWLGSAGAALGGPVKHAIVFYILSVPEFLIYVFPPSSRPGKYFFWRPAPGYSHITLGCTEKHTYMGPHLPSAANNLPIHWPVSTVLDKRAKVLKRIRILETPQKAASCTEETLCSGTHKLTPVTCESRLRCSVKRLPAHCCEITLQEEMVHICRDNRKSDYNSGIKPIKQ